MFESSPVLWVLVVPALGAIAIGALGGRGQGIARALAMMAMLLVLALSLRTFFSFDATGDMHCFDFHAAWMPSLGIPFHVGVDGFNIYLLLLGAILFPVVLASSWNAPEMQRPLYLALLLILEASLLGTFLAQNLILFFVFWETVLIPMGILILVFGGQDRYRAAIAFFMYTLAGSVLLLVAVIALGAEAWRQTGSWSFELSVLYNLQLDERKQMFVFVAILLACAVKCPLVPFHSWLLPAYYEAPSSASAIMSGALSKMGALGILKLALPLAPQAAATAGPYVIGLSVISILYGAFLALNQENYKKLVAYSSLSHMGYVVLGIFTFHEASIHGSMLQMLSHAMAGAGLFLLLGKLEEQRVPLDAHGVELATHAPRFAVLLMLFVLTSLALPLTSGFTAEFLVLFGTFLHGLQEWRAGMGAGVLFLALLACLGIVLGAAYMLQFARAILFDKAQGAQPVRDLRLAELLPFAVPLALILWIGIAPAMLMSKVQATVTQLSAPGDATHALARRQREEAHGH